MKGRPARLAKAPLRVDIGRRTAAAMPSARAIGEWAAAALGARAFGKEIAVQVVTPAAMRRLNRHFRGKDKPTNVLSFPSTVASGVFPQPLGDIVVCPAVLRREARDQGKPERAHWAHLVVHGTLHLVGYDHEDDADALRMERREISVLRRLGIPNPYRSP
ncbi:MAG: Endoribonuclease YbeY [Pseudomonadota bacterium]